MRRVKFLFLFILSISLFSLNLWRFPLPLRGGAAVAVAFFSDMALWLAALAGGRGLLSRLRLYHASLSEELIFSLGLGLAGLSLLGSFLGAVACLYSWVVWLCVGLLLLTQWDQLEHFGQAFQRNLRVKQPWDGSSSEVLTLVAGILGLLAVLGLCLAPVSFYDALNYHLPAVQRAVQTGADLPQASNLFSWLPDLAQPLWIFSSLMSGQTESISTAAPAFLNGFLALALGLALVEASSRWLSERKIWLAPALAWTQPLLVLSFGVFSPDPWMVYFTFISLFAFLNAVEETDSTRQGAWLCLAAFLAGAACAAKPVALMHAAILCLFYFYQAWKKPAFRRGNLIFLGALLFAVPLVPWFLHGLCLRNNPIYPFGLTVGGRTLLSGGPAAYFTHLDNFIVDHWWRMPWYVFFEPSKLAGGGHLSWLLLALALGAWLWRFNAAQRWLMAYVVLGAGLWCLGPHVIRYGLFVLPPACLLAAHGVLEVEAWAASKSWTFAWRALVVTSLFVGAGQTLLIATKDFRPWDVALGLQDPVEYLSERNVPQAEAAEWIRACHRPHMRVLVLGDARTAYLPPQALAASVYDEHPFKAWAANASSPEDLGALVRRKGYDFVLFSQAEWQRTENPAVPFYWAQGDVITSDRVRLWLQSLSAHPHLELSHGAGWVYDLR
jgi:hypothetical protein